MLPAQEGAGPPPAGGEKGASQAENQVGVEPPKGVEDASRHSEVLGQHHAAGTDDAGQLAQGRRHVGDIAEQVGEDDSVEGGVGEGYGLRRALDEIDGRRLAVADGPLLGLEQHRPGDVGGYHSHLGPPRDAKGDGAGAGGHVQDQRRRRQRELLHQVPMPAAVLAVAEQLGRELVAGSDAGEEGTRYVVRGHASRLSVAGVEAVPPHVLFHSLRHPVADGEPLPHPLPHRRSADGDERHR